MIRGNIEKKVVVIHDSLLPRYRGFAPLINALLNKEKTVGVTALYGDDEYDTGGIIKQLEIEVNYPIRIGDAIEKISELYKDLGAYFGCTPQKKWTIQEQIKELATYSPWLDEQDYFIDWSDSADNISNKVNVLGYPYKHAKCRVDDIICEVVEAVEILDIKIVKNDVGKIIKNENGMPTVICGSGCILIKQLTTINGENLLPFRKFRTRFM